MPTTLYESQLKIVKQVERDCDGRLSVESKNTIYDVTTQLYNAGYKECLKDMLPGLHEAQKQDQIRFLFFVCVVLGGILGETTKHPVMGWIVGSVVGCVIGYIVNPLRRTTESREETDQG